MSTCFSINHPVMRTAKPFCECWLTAFRAFWLNISLPAKTLRVPSNSNHHVLMMRDVFLLGLTQNQIGNRIVRFLQSVQFNVLSLLFHTGDSITSEYGVQQQCRG